MTNQFGTVVEFVVQLITIEEKSSMEETYLGRNKWALDLSEDIWGPILAVKPWLINKPRNLSRGFLVSHIWQWPETIDLLAVVDDELVEIAARAWATRNWETFEGWDKIPDRIRHWAGMDQVWIQHFKYKAGSSRYYGLQGYMAAFPRSLHDTPEVMGVVLSNYWYSLWAVKHTWHGFTTLEMRRRIVAKHPKLANRDARLKVKP